MAKKFIILVFASLCGLGLFAQRHEFMLEKNWKFTRGDFSGAEQTNFDDKTWQTVTVPHDWAIYGPFDRKNDLQPNTYKDANGNDVHETLTGRTGGLPYAGIGWYRNTFDVPSYKTGDQRVALVFDGAMSEAQVFVNGKKAIFWPYGYNSFHCDVTDLLNADGKANLLAVRLDNKPLSSRWYPGAGLYRNVHVLVTGNIHVPVWGTYLTTPYVSAEYASVQLKTEIENAGDKPVRIVTNIVDAQGHVVATREKNSKIFYGQPIEQHFTLDKPNLWSPETPYLYTAQSKIYADGKLVDEYSTRFGVRDIKFIPEKGFFLNGKVCKFQGVCNHHDLGPLGGAVNVAALRRQLKLLKDMGCNAIRTSHNVPAPELVQLCDEMGFMMMVEAFDEWDQGKMDNGYHRFFNDWAEKDLVNMVRHYRNDPAVILWSTGNEIPTQWEPGGYKVAAFLRDVCHREDPTRPVTCGMNDIPGVFNNGFGAVSDIAGINYSAGHYQEGYEKLPHGLILGSETASTVSARGVYEFPVVEKADAKHPDHQSSSYDVEYCSWSNIPDLDFSMSDDHPWVIGQFVWTGFDYIGEPTPYQADSWPNHTSLFGIIDLAGIPKDRYYLYRSVWNKEANTLHILPHWTWPGREGKVTPVYAYTNYPSAELFINGKSYGRQTKNKSSVRNRYRLMWENAVYEPGEVKVVAYDARGNQVAQETVRTAGKPHHLVVTPDRTQIAADGKDLVFFNVQVVDKEGNLCPDDQRLIRFSVKGDGLYKASANGDATCLNSFQLPEMPLFHGQLTAIAQSGETGGKLRFEASAKGLKPVAVEVEVR